MSNSLKKSNDMYIYIVIAIVCILSYLGYRYIKSTQEDLSKVSKELEQCKQNINDLSDFILQTNNINPNVTQDDTNNIDVDMNDTKEQFQEIQQEKPIVINSTSQIVDTNSVKDSDLHSIFSDTYSRKDDINNLDDFIVSMNKKSSKKSKAVAKRKPRQKKTKDEPKIEEIKDEPKIEEIKTEEKNEL